MRDADRMVVWLRAAMDAAQADAEAATPGPWAPEGPWLSDVVTSALLGRVADCSVGTGYRPQSLPDARHIARHDPAAVLRRIAADRTILNLHLPDDPDDRPECITCGPRYPCRTVQALANGWGWEEQE